MKSLSLHSIPALFVSAIAAFASVCPAQTPSAAAAADGLASISQTASRFENNMLTLAGAMPADKFNFAPSKDIFKSDSPAEFATVRTFAQQLTHVCGEPYRLFAPFGVKPDAGVDVSALDSLQSKGDIIKALKDSFAYQEKVIASITPENALTSAGPRNLTRISALIAILNDDGDHYGQMVEYLRMNGIVPPATINQTHRMAQPSTQK
jgi:hypothetical protein